MNPTSQWQECQSHDVGRACKVDGINATIFEKIQSNHSDLTHRAIARIKWNNVAENVLQYLISVTRVNHMWMNKYKALLHSYMLSVLSKVLENY